ncbi:hypothetical protein GCM10023238_26770 [Streptomyces heliomycini]
MAGLRRDRPHLAAGPVGRVSNMFTAYGANHSRLRRMVATALSARRTPPSRRTSRPWSPGCSTTSTPSRPGKVPTCASTSPTRCRSPSSDSHGVPGDQRAEFRTVVDNVFATHLTAEEQAANAAALYGQLDALIATKRTEPART